MKPLFAALAIQAAMILSDISNACTLTDELNGNTHHLNLPSDQCQTIDYTGGDTIHITLSYPQGRAVNSSWKGMKIDVLIYHVDSEFDLSAMFDDPDPRKIEKGIYSYRAFNKDHYRFKGNDGTHVYAVKRSNQWAAGRMYRGRLIIYLHQEDSLSFESADEFTMNFITKTIKAME